MPRVPAPLVAIRGVHARPSVERVYYPGLESHPQYALAQRQQKAGGAVVSFELRGGREAAWRVIDACKLLSITANLGDTKTTITHPSTTTHGRVAAEAREAGVLAFAVGGAWSALQPAPSAPRGGSRSPSRHSTSTPSTARRRRGHARNARRSVLREPVNGITVELNFAWEEAARIGRVRDRPAAYATTTAA